MIDCSDGISRLASHIEFGELLASTDPNQFLESVCDKIRSTEKDLAACRGEIDHLKKLQPQYDGHPVTQAALDALVGQRDKALADVGRLCEVLSYCERAFSIGRCVGANGPHHWAPDEACCLLSKDYSAGLSAVIRQEMKGARDGSGRKHEENTNGQE